MHNSQQGVVGLTWWIEKMESVFNISGCAIENQVKFATCTLLGAALTWWNGQIRTLGPKAYAMTWEGLKKKMTDKYCPLGEIQKLEIELWNLKVKGNDVPAYTERFQELTLICTKFCANETEKINKYIRGLPDNIYGNVKSSKPKTLDETIELANDLMDQKLPECSQGLQYGDCEKKPYGGNLPKCTKCHFHHNGPCTQKCHKCNKVGHLARDCRSSGNTNVANTQKGNGANPKGNGCFECGAPGHFKRDCPKLKNKDGGNGNAQGWVYVVGNEEKRGNATRNLDSNVVTGTLLLNNHYASILFDTGADRSFISTAFSSLINIAPTPLENSYDVELADGKIVGIDTIIRGCTLNFLDHPFNIDLMPVELGSFDVIIGMGLIVLCFVKKMSHNRNRVDDKLGSSSLWMPDFLAHIIRQGKRKDKSNETTKEVPTVRDFPEVFPEDLPVNYRTTTQHSDKEFIRPSFLNLGETRGLVRKKDEKEHEEHLKAILELLKKEKFYAKFFKCVFWIPKVHFLGHIIDSRGLVGYYRRFIEGFSKIAKSMTKLTQKGIKFDWGEKEENAF
ncbi:putative reverse transcriptase domain-containing protein [Tanacetum coccineum]